LNSEQLLFQPSHIEVHAGRLLHHIVRDYYRSEFVSQPHRRLIEIYERLAPKSAAWRDDLRGEGRVLTALRVFAHSRAVRLRALGLEVGCRYWFGEKLFTGQADLVYESDETPGACGILEFKLNDVEVRSEDPADKFLQCILYYLGLPEQFRDSCEKATIYIFDTGEQMETRIEQPLVDRAIRIIEETLPHAKGPDFPPTINPFCPSCGYQNLCPAYSQLHLKRA